MFRLFYNQNTSPIQVIQLCYSFIFISISRNAIPERLIEKIKERSDSLFSLSGLSPRLGRKRGSSGPSTIEPQGSRKLVVLGPSQVGKSSICATYASVEKKSFQQKSSNEVYNSCVFINSEEKNLIKQYQVELAIPQGTMWCGSVRGYKQLLLEADGFLLVYSKENRHTYMKLIELVADIQKLRKRTNPPIVVVGNKNDLEQGNTLGIHDSEQAVLGSFPHFNVSAVENDGLQEAFKCLVQMASQQHILS